MIRRIGAVVIFIGMLMASTLITIEVGGSGMPGDILSNNSFIDDVGNKILLDKPVKRIVSLSPVHTENLYTIGADALLIGVDEASNFPYETQSLDSYRLEKKVDQTKLLQAQADLVLIDPALSERMTALVSKLEAEGIRVVALMPETLDDFGHYMTKLGLITGREAAAQAAAQEFDDVIASYEAMDYKDLGVFVEASEKGYISPTEETLVGHAVRLAGGHQIIPTTPWYYPATSVSSLEVGQQYILDHNPQIDVYLSLQGQGYSGASLTSMSQKADFSTLNALETGKVYELESPLVTRYTMRYLDGIKELNRLFYGDTMIVSNGLEDKAPLTRIHFARVLYETLTIPTYVLNDDDYYKVEKFHHTYGAFKDVHWYEDDFDLIETVVMRSYLLPMEKDDGQWFLREEPVGQADIEHFIYIWADLKGDELMQRLRSDQVQLDEVDTVGAFKTLLEVMMTWQ